MSTPPQNPPPQTTGQSQNSPAPAPAGSNPTPAPMDPEAQKQEPSKKNTSDDLTNMAVAGGTLITGVGKFLTPKAPTAGPAVAAAGMLIASAAEAKQTYDATRAHDPAKAVGSAAKFAGAVTAAASQPLNPELQPQVEAGGLVVAAAGALGQSAANHLSGSNTSQGGAPAPQGQSGAPSQPAPTSPIPPGTQMAPAGSPPPGTTASSAQANKPQTPPPTAQTQTSPGKRVR
ncbi:hypothetical protein GCM10018772_59510 [Streptomyces fumanus]|uniref:Uncharacterized protein n=2 Tax=Streptomyces fumanus TaxID=67302 RepID=A0A919E9D7_9ACTN|nr:hypothetical protein GCM10018772_59510 [Streptomyces fumanus]